MDTKRTAVIACFVGVLSLGVQFLPEVFVDRWIGQGFPEWAPMFGTLGQSGLLYTYGAEIVGLFVTIPLAVGVGYYIGRRLAFSREYRRFLGAVVTGTTVPVVVAWGLTIAYGDFGSGLVDIILAIVLLLILFVTVSVVLTIGAFAGAALAHVKKTEPEPSHPSETSTRSKDVTSADHSKGSD